MSRFLIVALLALLGIPGAARASTIQYDLTLTPTDGSIGGSGYFDVMAPLNGSGVNTLTDFSVTIDGLPQPFTLANEVGTATATFSSDALSSLNYVGALINGFNLDILGSGGLTYAFLDLGTGATFASGTISAVAAPSAAPLPPTIVLFAAGLFVLGVRLSAEDADCLQDRDRLTQSGTPAHAPPIFSAAPISPNGPPPPPINNRIARAAVLDLANIDARITLSPQHRARARLATV